MSLKNIPRPRAYAKLPLIYAMLISAEQEYPNWCDALDYYASKAYVLVLVTTEEAWEYAVNLSYHYLN